MTTPVMAPAATLGDLNDAVTMLRDAVYARLHDRMTLLTRMRIGSCHLRAAAQAERTMPGGGMADSNPAYAPLIATLHAATALVAVPASYDEAAMFAMIARVSTAVQQVELLPDGGV